MELHLALKNIIETDGVDILNDVRLVNILNDFKAFDDIPASKYIIRMMISEGYMLRLLENKKWDSKTEVLCSIFSNNTGFQPHISESVFKCIAFALGWYVFECNSSITGNGETGEIVDNKRRTLSDIVSVDTQSMIEQGLSVANLFIEYSGKKTIHVSFEVSKTNENSLITYMVFFDKKGRIRAKEIIDIIYNDEHHKFMNKHIDLPILRTNMSKLLITAY